MAVYSLIVLMCR